MTIFFSFYIRNIPDMDEYWGFFSKKDILIPNVAEKNFWFWWREKNNLIQSFCQIT
jgi:hypothetical protein